MHSLNGSDSLVMVTVRRGGDVITWETSFLAEDMGVHLIELACDCASRFHEDVSTPVSPDPKK
jgi:hypothetical protein